MKTAALTLILMSLLGIVATAQETFEKNAACKECHPLIYNEFSGSQHAKSTIYTDEIHAAVWAKHPQNLKKKKYGCAHCHTPTADDIGDLKSEKGMMPDIANATHNEGVSCAYCHRIEAVHPGKKRNTNAISPLPKTYLTSSQKNGSSPFHTLKSDVDIFGNADVCMGCHSHKANNSGFNVCVTQSENALGGENCISCHMPKVAGSASTMHESGEHTFHGFPGLSSHQQMLGKYVGLALKRTTEGFDITIENQSPHALTLHPLRVMELRVTLLRGDERIALQPQRFVRLIGSDGKPTPPWLAKEVVKDTSIQKHEKRVVSYKERLQKDDRVTVTLGYYLVNPDMAENLGLGSSPTAAAFKTLKEASF